MTDYEKIYNFENLYRAYRKAAARQEVERSGGKV